MDRLAGLLATALLVGCAYTPPRGVLPEFPGSAGRWEQETVEESPLLVPGARVVTWFHRGWQMPEPYVRTVRDDGRDHAVRSVGDLRPFLRPVETPEQAVLYSWFLRDFPVPRDVVPGTGAVRGPETGGTWPDFDERLRARGIDPGPRVVATPEGFHVVRPVVVFAAYPAPGRLVEVREWIGRDGSYRYELGRVIDTGDMHDLVLFRL
jgi:hypothetical protein